MKHLVVLITALFAFAACGSDSPDSLSSATQQNHAPAPADAEPTEPLEPRMEDGVQVVDIEAGELGFAPVSVSLQTDVPARLVFTRTTEQTCATEVKIPTFDIGPIDLPLGEPVVVEFTPTETGEFRFACGMDMQEGALLVHS